MYDAIVAVAAAFGGSALTGTLTALDRRADRRAREATERRKDLMQAVSRLSTSLADHRSAMWHREELKLRDAHPDIVAGATALSHDTRSEITAPLNLVCMLAHELAPIARDAAEATYALRDPGDKATLDRLRIAAREASVRLVDATAHYIR